MNKIVLSIIVLIIILKLFFMVNFFFGDEWDMGGYICFFYSM